MSVDIEFWNKPSACLQNIVAVPDLFVSIHLSSSGVKSLPTASMLIWTLSLSLKSALNQSMRYLERTASDLPVSLPVQLNLKSSLKLKFNPLLSFTFSSLQNKVLAVIEAIEAAQYLISHNATHLINQVKGRSLSLCSWMADYVLLTLSSVLISHRKLLNLQAPLLATSINI